MPAIAGIIFIIGFLVFNFMLPQPSPVSVLSSLNFNHHLPLRAELNQAIKLNTGSAVVIDQKTKARLFDYNADEVRSIASLTKLMTALVFLDHNPGWDKYVVIEKSDLRSGARANIFVGDRIVIKDLLTVALLASDNSAISALVRASGLGEENFVKAMNEKAESLHLRNLKFVDPTGLNPDNKGSALAVAKLAEQAFKNEEISKRLELDSIEFKVSKSVLRKAVATNQLLGKDLPEETLLIGGKTGHLNEAGYCFAGVFKVKDRRLITAVLGSPLDEQRFSETLKILDWTIKAYLWEN